MKSVIKSKKKCFVIMPFKRLYKGRYGRIYAPAIEVAGLFPHLAGGAGVSTITEDIEKGIRNSHICFADISEDNPNVWYELGFAYACGKQVVMVCDRKNRPEKKLPFDISVKKVIFHPDVQSATNRAQFQQDIIDDLTEKAAIVPMSIAAPVGGMLSVAHSSDKGFPKLTDNDIKVLEAIIILCDDGEGAVIPAMVPVGMGHDFLSYSRSPEIRANIKKAIWLLKNANLIKKAGARNGEDTYKPTEKGKNYYLANRR